MGEFLKEMPKNEGARGVGKSGVPPENPTLADIGITKKQSATAQKLANIPEDEFKARIASALIPLFRPIRPRPPIRPRHQVPAPPLQAHTAS